MLIRPILAVGGIRVLKASGEGFAKCGAVVGLGSDFGSEVPEIVYTLTEHQCLSPL